MKNWQMEAIKKIDTAAQKAKEQVLTTPDNGYNAVRGEIDIWLIRRSEREMLSVKLYQLF